MIHLDDTFSYERVRKQVSEITDDVVVEGIYYAPEEREALLAAYRGKGARCVFIDTPLEVRKARAPRMIHASYPFLVPELDEGWDEIMIMNGDIIEFICRENSDYTMLPYK